VIVAVARLPIPRGRALATTVLFGVLSFAAFYALMYWALDRVAAGLATIVMAAVPLLTLLIATAEGQERFHWRGAAGAVLAGAGIVTMVAGPQDLDLPASALVAMLLAAAAVGQSVIIGRRISGQHPAVTNAVGMVTGAVLLLALSALAGETWALPRERDVVVAVGYLVAFGSAALFVLILLIVRRWTASATSYMFVLFPFVTLLLEAWLLDEPITSQAAIAAVLVVAGAWVGALSPAARRATVAVPDIAAPTPRTAEQP
jgi:drug/metabolite transporter (DMT)-like permease